MASYKNLEAINERMEWSDVDLPCMFVYLRSFFILIAAADVGMSYSFCLVIFVFSLCLSIAMDHEWMRDDDAVDGDDTAKIRNRPFTNVWTCPSSQLIVHRHTVA